MPVTGNVDPNDPWADEPGFEGPDGPREPTVEFSLPDLRGLELKRFLTQEIWKMAVQAKLDQPAEPQYEEPKVRPRGWRRAMGIWKDDH